MLAAVHVTAHQYLITNFCPPSIFLHQMWTVRFAEHVSSYTGCISEWTWFALSHFGHKNTTVVCCSLWENFNGNGSIWCS